MFNNLDIIINYSIDHTDDESPFVYKEKGENWTSKREEVLVRRGAKILRTTKLNSLEVCDTFINFVSYLYFFLLVKIEVKLECRKF